MNAESMRANPDGYGDNHTRALVRNYLGLPQNYVRKGPRS